MAECGTCGAVDDFYVEDGFYFCNECNTQSQDVRDIQQEDEFMESANMSSLRLKKSAESAMENKVIDRGKPWFTYEAFQCIIKEQVDSLLKKGVSPKLKDVVQQIWFVYLKTSGVAFTGKDVGRENIFDTAYARLRDRCPGTVDDPDIKWPYRLGRKPRASRAVIQSSGSASESDVPDWLSEEEFYPGDNPFSDLSGSSSSGTDDSDVDIRSVGSMDSQVHTKCKRAPLQKMTMDLTICFLYLALLLLGEPVLLCDLLRWINDGHVTYIAASRVLPKHMKFSLNDSNTFCTMVLPTNLRIRYKVGRLAHYIRIHELPPINVNKIAGRFILELQLPSEFHSYVRNLTDKPGANIEMTISSRKKRLVYFEGIAMAYVVVALKMMFVLDDNNEHVISENARCLQKSLPSGVKLFIWDEWTKFMKARMKLYESRSSSNLPRDVRKLVDIKPYARNFKEVTSKWKGIYSVISQKAKKRKQEVVIKEQQKPFHVLQEALREKSTDAPEMSSFCHPCPNSRDPADEETEQEEGQTFLTHTVQYVANSRMFARKMDVDDGRGGDSSADETEERDPDTNERSPGASNRGRTALDPFSMFSRARREYVVYPEYRIAKMDVGGRFPEANEEFHHSYRWLLELCAAMLQTTMWDMHDQVVLVEKMIGITSNLADRTLKKRKRGTKRIWER